MKETDKKLMHNLIDMVQVLVGLLEDPTCCPNYSSVEIYVIRARSLLDRSRNNLAGIITQRI